MSDDLTRLIVGSLATWRLASLLVHERGPFDVFVKVRSVAANTNNATLNGIISCVWCASIYLGLLTTLIIVSGWSIVLYPIGLSGAAIMIDSYVRHREHRPDRYRSGTD